MLRRVSYPSDPRTLAIWLAHHEGEWSSGAAYRLAQLRQVELWEAWT
jgi:hypothetical protein